MFNICRSVMGLSDNKSTLYAHQSAETQCSRHNSCHGSETSPAPLSDTRKYCKHSYRESLNNDNRQDETVSPQSSSSSSSSCSSTTAKSFNGSSSPLPKSFLPYYSASSSSIHQFVFCAKEISSRVLDLVFYVSNKNTGYLTLTKTLMTIIFITLSLNVCHTESRSTGVCRGIPCANGGQLVVSNSIWGNCRCRCSAGYAGPYCQYQVARKRNNSGIVVNNRLNRSEAMERIRVRLLMLAQRLDDLDAQESAGQAAQESNSNDEGDQATSMEAELLGEDQVSDTEVSIDAVRSLLRSRRPWLSSISR